MTSLVSIHINDELLRSMKDNAQLLHMSQADYIREAIEHMNNEVQKHERNKRFKKISLLVRKKSMHVNAEFSYHEA